MKMETTMEEMKTIYQVEGKLCKDFIGQISYTVCLDQTYGELDIEFSFGPQHFRPEDVTPELNRDDFLVFPGTELDIELPGRKDHHLVGFGVVKIFWKRISDIIYVSLYGDGPVSDPGIRFVRVIFTGIFCFCTAVFAIR